jgi:PAS domain S-box-containing protein
MSLNLVLNASGIGVWTIEDQALVPDEVCCKLLGLAIKQALPFTTAFQFVHPDDVPALTAAFEQGGRLDVTCRIGVRTVHFSGLGKEGILRDVTDTIESKHTEIALRESEARFRTIIEQAPMGLALMEGRDMIITLGNDKIFEIWGKTPDITGLPLMKALPELEGQPFMALMQGVYDTGIPHFGIGTLAKLRRNGVLVDAYFDFAYAPIRNDEGIITGVMTLATEVTERELASQSIARSEARFRRLIEEAPMATCLYTGRELIVSVANDQMLYVWGKNKSVIGKPLKDALPELEGQPFLHILDDVFTTGIPYNATAARAELEVDGVLGVYYFNFTYKPLLNEHGEVYAIINTAIDVTEEVLAHLALEEKEVILNNAIELAELGNWTVDLPTNTVTLAPRMAEWFGVPFTEGDAEVVMQTIHEDDRERVRESVLKALAPGSDGWYREEYTVINPVTNQRKIISAIGRVFSDQNGAPLKIEGTSRDITIERLYQYELEEKEAALRNAIELAELGTWSVDTVTGVITYSERLKLWLGERQPTIAPEISPSVSAEDQQRVREAVQKAMEKGGSGRFDQEYTVTNPHTGVSRVIHASGRTQLDEQGNVIRLIGTAQDITIQRDVQKALEKEVQLRTEELLLSNEQLLRSNEELAQYAYVASHDLQEPLRKILIYAGVLKNTLENHDLINKISGAAERMRMLILNLLDFSRLSQSDTAFQPVDLNTIVRDVFDDFELMANEKNAILEAGPLPKIEAVSLQMNQLFYNLISNSLKFTKQDVPPVITIREETLTAAEISEHIKIPLPAVIYHKICIRDNGIGFEQKYFDQIFEIFKRLHSRETYPGSGIGLALCRRIVTNHGGVLYPESKPGEGAMFCIILPDRH